MRKFLFEYDIEPAKKQEEESFGYEILRCNPSPDKREVGNKIRETYHHNRRKEQWQQRHCM